MRKLLKVTRNLALALVAIEIALQIASFTGRIIVSPDDVEAAGEGETVILAVGDSHTWGAAVDPEDSYPSQLQKTLELRFPNRSFRVVNLGIPGTNSAFVANRLERQILQIRPHLVILWVGINNLWNVLETESRGEAGVGTAIRRTLLRSKLFRMAMVTWHSRSLENQPAELTGSWKPAKANDEDPGWFWQFGGEEVRPVASEQQLVDSEIAAGLEFDHDRIVETSRALDTPVLFVNYPLAHHGVHATIAASGERLGVSVIDSRRSMRRAEADGHDASQLLVLTAGPHPTGLLYGYVVEDLMPQVIQSLEGADVIEVPPAAASPGDL